VSPLSFILISGRRYAAAPRRAAACAAILVVLAFACEAAHASARDEGGAIREADARRAEKVLAKLRLLYDAADSGDADAYRRLTSKLYPGLFVTASEMRPSDLGTDITTAVFIAEELGRKWHDAGQATADCRAERPDIYMPLCAAARAGTVRQLLLAKSRLHARWAEAALSEYEGRVDAETARTLAETRAARANDLLIAARVVELLRSLEGLAHATREDAGRGERFSARAADDDEADAVHDEPDATHSEALSEAAALLAWMPRGETFYQLSNARLAYADGLWWRGKARESKRLVVSANGFAPDPLKELRLDAGQVAAAADANWKSAAEHTRLAEQTLPRPSRTRTLTEDDRPDDDVRRTKDAQRLP
jgi:hypothetical protein